MGTNEQLAYLRELKRTAEDMAYLVERISAMRDLTDPQSLRDLENYRAQYRVLSCLHAELKTLLAITPPLWLAHVA